MKPVNSSNAGNTIITDIVAKTTKPRTAAACQLCYKLNHAADNLC